MELQQFRNYKLLRKESTGGWLATTDDGKFGILPEFELSILRKEGIEESDMPGLIMEFSVKNDIGDGFQRLSRIPVHLAQTHHAIGRELVVKIHAVANGRAFASLGSVFDGTLKIKGRKFEVGEEVSVVIDRFSSKHRTFRLHLSNPGDQTALADTPSTKSKPLAPKTKTLAHKEKPPNNPFSGLKELLSPNVIAEAS